MAIAPIPEIVDELKAGRIVVLVDDEDRENEGDLVFAADFVTPDKINFLAKHGRGLVCMPITAEHAERLNLAPMTARNRSVHGTNFTMWIEAAEGVAGKSGGAGCVSSRYSMIAIDCPSRSPASVSSVGTRPDGDTAA